MAHGGFFGAGVVTFSGLCAQAGLLAMIRNMSMPQSARWAADMVGPYSYGIKTRLKCWVSRSAKLRRIFAERGLVFFVGQVHLSPERRWCGAEQISD